MHRVLWLTQLFQMWLREVAGFDARGRLHLGNGSDEACLRTQAFGPGPMGYREHLVEEDSERNSTQASFCAARNATAYSRKSTYMVEFNSHGRFEWLISGGDME